VTRREKGYIVLEQRVAGAVDEGAAAVAEHVKSHDQGAVQHDLRSCLRIFRTKIVLDAVTEQQFVARDFLILGENRLASDKPQTGRRNSLGRARIGCRSRSVHGPFIGRSAERVQAAGYPWRPVERWRDLQVHSFELPSLGRNFARRMTSSSRCIARDARSSEKARIDCLASLR